MNIHNDGDDFMDHHLHKSYFFMQLNEFFANEKISLKKVRVQPKTNLWFQFNIVRNLPSNILISQPVDPDTFIPEWGSMMWMTTRFS